MNCKQGDLAVIVKVLNPKNSQIIGKIVRCIEPVVSWDNIAGWAVDPPLSFAIGVADENLRPIRDNDGEDETLQWSPVPTKETE
jgi:hypothetical protein